MSRDVAVANAETFCGQGEKVVKYNEGSINELELSALKTGDDTRSPKDDPNCLGRLRDFVIDGCDGNDLEKNPHNYKFGSKLTSSDGWVYEMKPLSEQINEVSCDVTWQFYDDFFEIRGKNVLDANLGANGEGLKRQLRGCGSLTAWNFQPTPQDVKFQWKASGQLPVGTRRCVGNALKSAGGADRGNCRGLGLRSHLS
ncbi:hypothetical protein RirG_044830 [Rhizophagus irregularis DAOM 197198w]|uniref:Uncharacterized protein n=1 Tax=Rhizophagus irregularis (strain DAOM 197198w) TaxID=1432141 RepID=A0A015N7E1_RHIIW|nr:hypothetical protein RirG_044830 [Rhizophagus irregularis DAOM 197198w]